MNERDLFIAALQIEDPAGCASYLQKACGGDADLRQRVEALLAAFGQAGSFLQQPAAAAAATSDVPPAELSLPSVLAEGPGAVIGPYKLLQQIGEGGMGTVFLAEQIHPVQRQVALKLIKFGMDSRQVIARFEAERQALALMDHPNIAKVLDAGTTASGRPYFVMDLVKGVPITRYCDERHLTPTERLELFVPVCRAVQHAHQKGIIHRDLKPSNVMVCLYDGKPVPKVIDFGVAKATGPKLTGRTLFTEIGSVVGTLEYMSPEQAELNQIDVDTRSDIYALGVLLYELLTGTTPLERKRLKQAAFLEVLRLIREEEPPRPSTRLSSSEELPSIAIMRGLEPKKLSGLVRGDLDWIVMKALDKDRNRRYETANGLAREVERYLHDEPVQASPPSAAYRFRKFTRRNKRALATATVVALAVLLAVGTVAWSGLWQARQRAEAERAAEGALADAGALQVEGKWPEALLTIRRTEPLLNSGVLGEGLRQRVAERLEDLNMVARLDDIRLQKAAVKEDHFDFAQADPAFALAFREYGIDVATLAPEEAAERLAARGIRVELAAALDDWTEVCRANSRGKGDTTWIGLLALARAADPDELRNRLRDALERNDAKALKELAASGRAVELPLSTLVLLGRALAQTGADEQAVAVLREGQRRHPGNFWINHELAFRLHWGKHAHLEEAVRYYTAAIAVRPLSPGAHLNLGTALRYRGQLDEAIAAYREAIRLQKDYATAHAILGDALRQKGRPDEAIAECREALRLKQDSHEAYNYLGVALRQQGRLDEAIAACREALRLKKDYPEAYNHLGIALHEEGRLDEAIDACREALRLKKDFPEAHNNLGNTLLSKGRTEEAIAAFREALRLKQDDPVAHNNLGRALLKKGQLDEAIDAFREALRLKQDYPMAHNNLANSLHDKGRLDEAIAAYQESLRLKKDQPEVHYNLGNVLYDKGRLDEAIVAYRGALRLKKDYFKAHHNLGGALLRKGWLDEAIAAFREARRLKKDYPEAHYSLGRALYEKGRLDEAIAAYREALRLNKDFPRAHNNLGSALQDKGQLDDAIAEYQEAIRLNKENPKAHINLGSALKKKGRLDDAIAAYREAIRLNKDSAVAHYYLGRALLDKGRLDDAIAAYREAIRLNKDYAEAYYSLGNALQGKGRLDDAIAEYREAIRLREDYPEAHCNMGHVLLQLGRFADALTALKRGHELSSRNPRWPYPSAQWVRSAERLVELDAKLPKMLNGEARPVDTAERLALAQLCQEHKKLYAAAARFYAEAFVDKPQLAEDLLTPHRYNAACAAALAGHGQGQDAATVDDPERSRLRRQALTWLRADLAAWRKRLEADEVKSRLLVRQQMRDWLADSDFAGVRDPEVLTKLPETERQDWQKLWAEVKEQFARCSEKSSQQEK